ncbi:MAG: DegT/DnrJ/EryC1/StrS family aminotransferase [bacterium]
MVQRFKGSRVPLFQPWGTRQEGRAVARVLRSHWWAMGPEVARFEREFLEALAPDDGWHAVMTNSGTAALHLALVVAGVCPGRSVVMPSFNFVSAAHCVRLLGGEVIFCDVRDFDLNLDPVDAEVRAQPNTVALVALHYAGNACVWTEIEALRQRKPMVIIEDVAHACGARTTGWRPAGFCGDLGCFSFHAVKHIASPDAGMVVTRNRKWAEAMRRMRWLGISRDTGDKETKPDYSITGVGFKYTPNDIAAAICRVQLRRWPRGVCRRRAICRRYDIELFDLPWLQIPEVNWSHGAPLIYWIRVKNQRMRDALREHLRERGIDSAVHFRPLHLEECYRRSALRLPVTERESSRLLCLPVYPEMSRKTIRRVVQAIRDFGEGRNGGN